MRKLTVFIGGILALAVFAWCAGLVWFAATMPRDVADTATHTDAIVVLTGGSERIDTGLRLLAEGRADKLYISGVGAPTRTNELLARAASDPQLGTRISIGTAANTPGNAVETAQWVRSQGVGSIRLVTAAYHMRRSLLELHNAMPGVTIIPHPVFPANVKDDWWRWPGTASLIAREYTKFTITWVWQQMGLGDELPTSRAAGTPHMPFMSASAHAATP
jgi:uncharacterized SAM-binding protein YcdF (DUF218 family)